MKALVFVCVTAISLLAAGGATAQTNSSAPAASAAAPVASPASLQPVRVPVESAKKIVLRVTGSKDAVEARDWAAFKEEWRATFADHAKEAGIAFSMQEGEAQAAGDVGTLLTVHVVDYRKVSVGARIFLGFMAGSAFIESKIGFSDLATGQRFGEQLYDTNSAASWGGVFEMSSSQVDVIATRVFAEFKPR